MAPCIVLVRQAVADQIPVGSTNVLVSGTISPTRQTPTFKWITVTVGHHVFKKAVLRVESQFGFRRQDIKRDLDLWSGAFRRRFHRFDMDDELTRVVHFFAQPLPDAVGSSDILQGLPPFSGFFGIGENLCPIVVDFSATPGGAVYAGSGQGKSSWLASTLHSVASPEVRIVVVTTKQLTLFRSIPGAQVFNAAKIEHMRELRTILAEQSASAADITDLLDRHGMETIEALYKSGLANPRTTPRWLFALDEAKDYLRPLRKATKEAPYDELEEIYAELITTLSNWMRRYRFLSRHLIILTQSGAAGDLDIEIANLGYKVLGPQRPAMAQALVNDLRPANEKMPPGTFFITIGNDLVKFRGLYTPSLVKPEEDDG
jgi:hypothetical protein